VEINRDVYIPLNIDSLAIITDYFSKYKYTDTLKLEGLGSGYVIDIISENRIQSREIRWDYKIPTILDTRIVKELPKNQVYIGVYSQFDKLNVVNSIGTGFILKTKNDRLYQLNGGISNSINGQINPFIGGGLYWKIRLKK
jgi:hypothetical protein